MQEESLSLDLKPETLPRAGARHIVALGRSGRLQGGASAAAFDEMLEHGWAAAVTITKCDVAFAEDSRAVLSADRSSGERIARVEPAARHSLSLR